MLVCLLGLALGFYYQSLPEQSPAPVEKVNDSAQSFEDLIYVDAPLVGQVISQPLIVTGKARGTWFFEASFPVVLTNWDGLIIAEGLATAQSNWMTEDFVPFVATLEYSMPGPYNRGALILQKDNPSGLPEYDAALEIPVLFW